MPRLFWKRLLVKSQTFLLEIGVENLPASFVEPAVEYMRTFLDESLKSNGLTSTDVKTFGTNRRLIAACYDVPEKQEDRKEVLVGPSVKVAFKDGKPTRAAIGFATHHGKGVDDLVKIENPQGRTGEYIAVRKFIAGRPAANVLSDISVKLIKTMPFRKNMRWDRENLKFARPIRWIVAIYGNNVVSFEIAGVKSSNISYGNRLMSPSAFVVNPDTFLEDLESRYVIADIGKRKAMVLDGVRDTAKMFGGKVLEDEDLLDEVTNLVEFPYPIGGLFDKAFLELPKEVPITVMKDHQRYFSVLNDEGELENSFVAISNVKPVDDSVVRYGYEKVLKARLSDALFFFREDRKRPLSDRVKNLSGILFHKLLGTMYDKTLRLKILAPFVSDLILPNFSLKAERAALLSKADLTTQMVNEFPELQGIMGSYYAKLDGEDSDVAYAIREQYLPKFSGGRVARTVVGMALSIAEKIDNLIGFFGVGLKPSGSEDPFGLRRNAIGIIQTVMLNKLDIDIIPILKRSESLYIDNNVNVSKNSWRDVLQFIRERFKILLESKGINCDTIDAVLPTSGNLMDILKRAESLDSLRETGDFQNVLFTFRRVLNIIPKNFEPIKDVKPKGDYETKLLNAFYSIQPQVNDLLGKGDYRQALLKLASLKLLVDKFFDNVLVMDKDMTVRNRRLSIVSIIADKLSKIADFSKIAL